MTLWDNQSINRPVETVRIPCILLFMPIQAVLTVIDFLTSKGSSALDISKAFDTVCHAKLFKSLIKAGVPGWIIKLIRYRGVPSSGYRSNSKER